MFGDSPGGGFYGQTFRMTEFSDLDWPALFVLRTLEIYVPLQKANAIRVECYIRALAFKPESLGK